MSAIQTGRDDGSIAWIDQGDSRYLQRLGGSSGLTWGGGLIMRVPLGVLDTAGGVLSVANPFGRRLQIHRLVIDLLTASTGAGTADFGVAATSVTNDSLLDGLDMNAAAGLFDNITDKGTNGKSKAIWAATGFLTGTKATGNMAGLAGFAYVHFVDP